MDWGNARRLMAMSGERGTFALFCFSLFITHGELRTFGVLYIPLAFLHCCLPACTLP